MLPLCSHSQVQGSTLLLFLELIIPTAYTASSQGRHKQVYNVWLIGHRQVILVKVHIKSCIRQNDFLIPYTSTSIIFPF